MPLGKQELQYRKTFDLGERTLECIRITMEFYGEPTEVGAVRRTLEDMAKLIGLTAHGGQLFLDHDGKVERILLFEKPRLLRNDAGAYEGIRAEDEDAGA